MSEFDSWSVRRAGPARNERVGTTIEDKFPESLVDRARKREVVDVRGGWLVKGNPKLGDSYAEYDVTLNPETHKYDCSCYRTQYGQSRKRKICSHALAVVLHRRTSRGEQVGEGVSGEEREESETMSAPTTEPLVDGDVSPSSSNERDAAPFATRDHGTDGVRDLSSPLAPGADGDDMVSVDEYGGEWPEWLTGFRPHQIEAVEEIVDAFRECDVVFLDAPTGSGKTLIGEMVRRRLTEAGGSGVYICSGKDLQDQFLRDYPYAKVLKGRSNYVPLQTYGQDDVTCAECDKHPAEDDEGFECSWCPSVPACPYERAKMEALRSPIAVVNTSYMLYEANYVGGFSGRKLLIVDECDVLEKELMGFVEFELRDKQLKDLGLEAPKKGSHYTTIGAWMQDELLPAVKQAMRELGGQQMFGGVPDPKVIKQRNSLMRLVQDIERVQEQIASAEGKTGSRQAWVRDNDAGPMSLKPVRVDQYGPESLWRHGDKILLMSATIISPDEMADSLGLGKDFRVVRVPMTFPVEHRPIYVCPWADMARKNEPDNMREMVEGVARVLARHPEDRILVHAVSYKLARALVQGLYGKVGREVISYSQGWEREGAIRRYRETERSVIIAPSLDRGVDFKDEDCRVVVVAKVPYPSLGDKQVSTRTNGPGGDTWYAVQTVRTIVQMTGRGVRSKNDWAHTYILDRQFSRNVWKRNRGLFPSWWREAVEILPPSRL